MAGFFYLARNSSGPLNKPVPGTVYYDPFPGDAAKVKASNAQVYLGSSAAMLQSLLPAAMKKLHVTSITISKSPVQGGPSALDVIGAALGPIAPELIITAVAGAGAAATAAGSAAAGGAGKAASTLAGAATSKTGLAALLGATGWAEFGVRALEALGGAALILLGLQALTGGSGNPADAVKRTVKMVK